MSAGHTIYEGLGSYKFVGAAAATAVVLTGVGIVVKVKASARLRNDDVLPDDGFSFLNLASQLVSAFRGLLSSMIGHGSDKYLHLILGTFLFILVNNLAGMFPGLLSPSQNLINNISMAIVIFVVYQFYGIKEHGFGYLKQFTGGLPPKNQNLVMTVILSGIAILIFGIELIGHAVRPVSLSLRLWGTITGDHALHDVMKGILPLFLPMIAMALGLLVSVVQAFVFSLLSTVYIKLAVSHDH